jgi:hypothetical protein
MVYSFFAKSSDSILLGAIYENNAYVIMTRQHEVIKLSDPFDSFEEAEEDMYGLLNEDSDMLYAFVQTIRRKVVVR